MHNASPHGRIDIRLPTLPLTITAHLGHHREQTPCTLETVLVEPDADRLGLVFRGAFHLDKKILRIDTIAISQEP